MSDIKAMAVLSKNFSDGETSAEESSVSLKGSPTEVKVTSDTSISNSKGTSRKNVDLTQFARTPNDSNDPSYTDLTLPYSVIARMRYRYAGAKQKAQFAKELEDHELLQSNALDGCRIHREFCNAVLKPVDPKEMITLTDKQKEKIEEILERKDDFYY